MSGADREAQDATALGAEIAVFGALLQSFGQKWADEPVAPSVEPEEIARVRALWAVPASNGAAIALAKFCWLTAPTGSTADQLATHLQLIVHQGFLAAYQTADAGDFWLHVERYTKELPDGG